MKAVLMEAPGSRHDFVEKEIEKPELKAYEVLIEIHVTALNPVDIIFRTGKYKMEDGFPAILSVDIAGVIAEVGSSVTAFSKGDEVFTSKKLGTPGGLAEYVAVSEELVLKKPENISFEEAASLGIAALTAYQLVNSEPINVKEGETVLIQSGTGGVGTFAVQFAKQNGAHVIATTSRNEDLLNSLGVDEIVNYKDTDVVEKYKDSADVLIDTAGRRTETLPVVKDGGRAITSSAAFDEEAADKRNISTKRLTYSIETDQLEKFAKHVADGDLKVVIDEVFEFSKSGVMRAHELLESGHAKGKIIVRLK